MVLRRVADADRLRLIPHHHSHHVSSRKYGRLCGSDMPFLQSALLPSVTPAAATYPQKKRRESIFIILERARMSMQVRLLHASFGDVRVNLRGGKRGVAEQFLHGAQISAGVQHVGGKGVAQLVG